MISYFKNQKVIEKRVKFLPAVIKKDPEDEENFVVRILDDKAVKVRTYNREIENEPFSVVTETRIEENGDTTQRYTTTCFFHQVPTPVWYAESLFIDLKDKTQKINEKVYYENKYRANNWSETYTTDVISNAGMFLSETVIPIQDASDEIHYISLEPQQKKEDSTTELEIESF